MSGTWEPANQNNEDDQQGFFGDVDGIVFRDTDSGPAELRYRGGAADIYDDVPEATPAPEKRRWRSESIWSPNSKNAVKKPKNTANRAALKRLIPLVTMLVVLAGMGVLFWFIGTIVLAPQGTP